MNRTNRAAIEVRGARTNNLRNIDIDIPLVKSRLQILHDSGRSSSKASLTHTPTIES